MNITTSPSLSAAPSVSVAPSISTAPSVSAAPSVTPLQFYTKGNHACAFYPSEVQCFGYNVYGELGNPNFTTSSSSTPITMTYSNISASPVKVVTGEGSTCILMDDGSVYCYGLNNYRQLGNFKTTNSRTAVRVKLYSTSLTGATDIVGQYYHYCAIYGNDDKIYCWGWNTSNQLGWNGSLGAKMITATFHSTCVVFKNDPEKVHCKGSADWNDKSYEMDQTITKLTSGIHHVCALLADQTAKCFGLNGDGQLGNGSTIPNYNFASHVLENRNTPLSKITDINAGYYSTCLVADGKPMCFGNNVNYQLGIANGGADVRYPRQVGVAFLPEDGAVVVSAHVGAYNGYVVMSDDSVYSWGKNSFGGLGDGSTSAALIIADTNGEPARKVAFDW